MPAVMPSQIVATIDEMFSNSKPGDSHNNFTGDHSSMLASVADLVDAVPDELLTACPPADHVDLIRACSTIREMCNAWQGNGINRHAPVIRGKDVVKVIRHVMAQLPDENATAAHTTLGFIADQELRDSIHADVGAAHRALGNAEWKPATVMAGASIEALLHWRLEQVSRAKREAVPRAPAIRKQKKDLNDFGLHEYIEVAQDLGLIDNTVATMALLAKGFRNLIHPGKVARTKERCTRSTAHAAVAAMEAVIERFSVP